MSSVNFKVGKTCGVHRLQWSTPCVAFSCTTWIVFSAAIFTTRVLGYSDACSVASAPSPWKWDVGHSIGYCTRMETSTIHPFLRHDRMFWSRNGCCTEMFWLLSEECETPVWHDVVWPGLRWEGPRSGLDLLLYNRFETIFKEACSKETRKH